MRFSVMTGFVPFVASTGSWNFTQERRTTSTRKSTIPIHVLRERGEEEEEEEEEEEKKLKSVTQGVATTLFFFSTKYNLKTQN